MYANYIKKVLDSILSGMALIILSPVLLILTILGAILMKGNPFFLQPRPGKKDINGQETIFYLIKFRSMTNERDKEGKLLPDEYRLKRYGKWLRSSSLDELPELINVLKGDMSLVGPRPQLVRDMVFMTPKQRRRHDVMPGITGLAQISGRNNISWEQKFEYDLKYIDNGITFRGDIKILLKTVKKVLEKRDVVRNGTVSDLDFGDILLKEGKIDQSIYDLKQIEAKDILKKQ